jgi:hypothetical protein
MLHYIVGEHVAEENVCTEEEGKIAQSVSRLQVGRPEFDSLEVQGFFTSPPLFAQRSFSSFLSDGYHDLFPRE